jgi:penicillin G amidase
MQQDYSRTETDYAWSNYHCRVARNSDAVAVLKGQSLNDLAFGLGLAHGRDRALQMEMARLAGEGRLSECLKSNDETESIDRFMREMGMHYQAKKEVSKLTGVTLDYLEAYAQGVNLAWEKYGTPWEFKLVNHRPAPWKPEHTLLTIKLMSYIGLAQTQEDVERLIIQSVRQGIDLTKLKNLFSPHLDELTSSRCDLLKKLKYLRAKLPIELRTLSYLPRLLASNNWVIAPSKAKSRKPIMCADPHLEVNRLPGVWYEIQANSQNNSFVGITMPGVPGLVMGRTKFISYSFTYGFMDMVDFFVEEIQAGKALTNDGPRELNSRKEIIKRKKKKPLEINIFETQNGVLELPEDNKIENGLYLSRAWSNHHGGMVETVEALMLAQEAKSCDEFCQVARNVAISCNWLVADHLGEIAYQQSGRAPKRSGSGLVPLEAWQRENQWNGLVSSNDLCFKKNPSNGFLATANNDIPRLKNEALTINLPMGPYRINRIAQQLDELNEIGCEEMKRLQNDLYSTQAEAILAILNDDFPETPMGQSLKMWDRNYNCESFEASLFEIFYKNLLQEVFGDNFFGDHAMNYVMQETSTIADYYHLFDRILLSDDEDTLELWFGSKKGRSELFAKCLSKTLSQSNSYQLRPWGQVNQIHMHHLFFQGKLPRFLGFDHGPVELPGCRATIVQGAVYRAHGRDTSFAPSWRMVTDLGQDYIWSALAGGASDRRFDPSYKSDISALANRPIQDY